MSSLYTKKAFADTLQQLLHKKNLDNIRVGDICEACHLSKKSFYYHFRDKYDLALYLYNDIFTENLKDFGVKHYLQDLEMGNPALHYLTESSVSVGKTCYRFWRQDSEFFVFSKNLLRIPKDSNSPLEIRRIKDINGKKNILKKRLEEENGCLDEAVIDIAASSLFYLTCQFTTKWDQYALNDLPDSEVKLLIDAVSANLEAWIALGKKYKMMLDAR